MDIGLTQMKILWILRERSRHGYEIYKELLKERKVEHPNIYSSLRKLKTMGLIKSRKDGRRTVYAITERGKRILDESLEEFVRLYEDFFREAVCKRCVLWGK